MLLGVLGWLVLGAIFALVSTKLVNLRGDDPRITILIGAAGGIVGGWMYSWISGSTVVAWDVWSLACAAIAAVAALAVWHGIHARTPYAGHTTRRSY
jgi:uncharacterized membrane protein YeaQ/YmgE (transglycosylase-associated protein family)